MIFDKYDFYLDTDFPVRILRENDLEIDLIIDLDQRVLNLKGIESEIISERIQFSTVRHVVIRLAKNSDEKIGTFLIMRSTDLSQPLASFTLNYSKHKTFLKEANYQLDLFWVKK